MPHPALVEGLKRSSQVWSFPKRLDRDQGNCMLHRGRDLSDEAGKGKMF